MATHIDDFIIDYKQDAYARAMFVMFRLPAIEQELVKFMTEPHKLFCTWKGRRYRVIGASRLGDIWLTSKFDQSEGYEERVDVDDVSDFSPQP